MVRNAKVSAAHLPKNNKKGGCHPAGWQKFRLPCLKNWVARAKRDLPLRAKRALKGMGLIRKKGKTIGVPLLVRSAAAQAANTQLRNMHIYVRVSG